MQANPAHLPIEMISCKSPGQQYLNGNLLAPPDAADTEEHTKLQDIPACLPSEMTSSPEEEEEYIVMHA